MGDELRKAKKDLVDSQVDKQAELEKKYPPNPPNEVCNNAYIKGLLIENSFNPKVGERNELFETAYEKLFVWTHEKNKNSIIVIDVDFTVKDIPFWKNAGSVIWMAMQYSDSFEGISSKRYEYRWIYYFNPEKNLSEQVFNNLVQFDEIYLTSGRVIKATDIGNIAPEIELMMRDDKAYTAKS